MEVVSALNGFILGRFYSFILSIGVLLMAWPGANELSYF